MINDYVNDLATRMVTVVRGRLSLSSPEGGALVHEISSCPEAIMETVLLEVSARIANEMPAFSQHIAREVRNLSNRTSRTH